MILFIKEKRTCFLLLFIIFFTASAYSQKEERRVISNVIDLRECLRIGLENNFDLQIARNQELVSENNVTLGNAGYLPQVSVSSGYNLRSSNTDQIPAEGDEVVENRNSNTQTLDAGINLNWSLFEGFRVQTNYKRLKELQSAGELYTRLEMENLIANLTAEYYNYVQQQIRLGNLQGT